MEFLGFHSSMPLDKILRVADTFESVREYMGLEELLVDRARAGHLAFTTEGVAAEAYEEVKIIGEFSKHEFEAVVFHEAATGSRLARIKQNSAVVRVAHQLVLASFAGKGDPRRCADQDHQ